MNHSRMARQTDVIVAIITSAISLVTAAVTAIFVRKNDSRLKHLEKKAGCLKGRTGCSQISASMRLESDSTWQLTNYCYTIPIIPKYSHGPPLKV